MLNPLSHTSQTIVNFDVLVCYGETHLINFLFPDFLDYFCIFSLPDEFLKVFFIGSKGGEKNLTGILVWNCIEFID